MRTGTRKGHVSPGQARQEIRSEVHEFNARYGPGQSVIYQGRECTLMSEAVAFEQGAAVRLAGMDVYVPISEVRPLPLGTLDDDGE